MTLCYKLVLLWSFYLTQASSLSDIGGSFPRVGRSAVPNPFGSPKLNKVAVNENNSDHEEQLDSKITEIQTTSDNEEQLDSQSAEIQTNSDHKEQEQLDSQTAEIEIQTQSLETEGEEIEEQEDQGIAVPAFRSPSAIFENLTEILAYEKHTSLLADMLQVSHKEAATNSNLTRRIVLKRSVSESHCPRPHSYKTKNTENEIVQQVDISPLNKLLELRIMNGTAVAKCGAIMSMHDLVEALLPLGYIPACVPEFKGITVGGSIQGLAAESTSFRYGLYHDSVHAFDVLLSNGTFVTCSPASNSDLFYGLPGSFGSLGICTSADVECIPAKDFVEIRTRRHWSKEDCVSYMKALQNKVVGLEDPEDLDSPVLGGAGAYTGSETDLIFLEGIGYAEGRFLSIEGRMVSGETVQSKGLKLKTCNTRGSRWFYNLADKYHRKHHSKSKKVGLTTAPTPTPTPYIETGEPLFGRSSELLGPDDEIGMSEEEEEEQPEEGQAPTDAEAEAETETETETESESEAEALPSVEAIAKGVEEREQEQSTSTGNDEYEEEEEEDEDAETSVFAMPIRDYLFRHDRGSFWMASYRIPQVVGRYVMGPLLDSSNMFKLANAIPWAFPKKVIVLQDFMLPVDQVCNFIEKLEEQLDLWPIWLLPMRNTNKGPEKSAIFAMPTTGATTPGVEGEERSSSSRPGHYCNVGAYGIPKKGGYDFIPANEKLETLLWEHGGRKVFYSHAFYDRAFFYHSMYDGARYDRLRAAVCPDASFPEIYDKIVTKNGQL